MQTSRLRLSLWNGLVSFAVVFPLRRKEKGKTYRFFPLEQSLFLTRKPLDLPSGPFERVFGTREGIALGLVVVEECSESFALSRVAGRRERFAVRVGSGQ